MEKKPILVVDDDESVLEYLETSLVMQGYEVTTASTATQALGKLRDTSRGFPLILSDIVLPGIDGIELLKTIRKSFPDTMVIMLTAYSSTESAVKSLNEGAFAYLRKPVNLDELNSVLNNALRSYTLQRENDRLVGELKKAKEYSEAIIENLVYLVVATDVNGTIKKVNRAVTNLLGYEERELIGMPIANIFSKEFSFGAWNEMIRENRVTGFPVDFCPKSGQLIRLHFTGTIMKDAEGQVLGFLGSAKA